MAAELVAEGGDGFQGIRLVLAGTEAHLQGQGDNWERDGAVQAFFHGPASGAVIGSFVGAMMTQGIEKELAYYYDQAVTEGKILVAVELRGKGVEPRLAIAEEILFQAGAEPIELPEG